MCIPQLNNADWWSQVEEMMAQPPTTIAGNALFHDAEVQNMPPRKLVTLFTILDGANIPL